MGITDDRNDPCIGEIDPETNMQACYLVLSQDEIAKGYVRPLHVSYMHETCGGVTSMNLTIAETYARQPDFYGGTYCATCKDHFPVGADGEFVWTNTNDKVGT